MRCKRVGDNRQGEYTSTCAWGGGGGKTETETDWSADVGICVVLRTFGDSVCHAMMMQFQTSKSVVVNDGEEGQRRSRRSR